MIELKVEDYCQECTQFEPESDTSKLFDENKVLVHTRIMCTHRHFCNHIYKMIERKYKDEL